VAGPLDYQTAYQPSEESSCNWPQIVGLYEVLLRLHPTPVGKLEPERRFLTQRITQLTADRAAADSAPMSNEDSAKLEGMRP